MIRASASAAASRPTAGATSARRRVRRLLLLSTVLALVGAPAVGQSAAAYDRGDDIWVSADGVAFERGWQSDQVEYVVRSTASRNDGKAFSRDLTRDEQRNGWAPFAEARSAYPDGYCVVWVQVEDASSWHTNGSDDSCTATRSAPEPTEQADPTEEPAARSTPQPAGTPAEDREEAAPPAAAPPPDRTPSTEPTQAPAAPPPSPTPAPSAPPSPTPSSVPSNTPSPSPSASSPLGGLVQQPTARAQVDQAAEQDDVISPLGWVAVLGGGALLVVGGALMLLRRLI